MLTIGALVDGKYKIVKVLGRGGTSCVFLAENIRLKNYWAIKEVYKNGVAGVAMSGGKLIAESDILKRLRHPGLPAIADVIETYQSYLIVMEYIQGISLEELLKRGPQTEENVRKWCSQLCDVLHYLHTQRPPIIYRDMKPGNVMLKPDGNVVLIDFGMAREYKVNSNHDTVFWGTHGYAAPEQYDDNRQSDARTDIYGLGMTMYHLITGQDPCAFTYGKQPIRKFNPNISQQFEQILTRCTQLEPEDRYQSAFELKQCLMNGRQSVYDMDGVWDDDEPKKNKGAMIGLIVGISVGAVVLIGGIALAIGLAGRDDSYGTSSNYTDPYGQEWGSDTQEEEDDSLTWTADVTVNTAEESLTYEFVPPEDGYYSFSSSYYGGAPVGWLYDSNYNEMGSDNIYGEYSSFYIEKWLTAGETYYLETTLYYLNDELDKTGSYTLYIEKE